MVQHKRSTTASATVRVYSSLLSLGRVFAVLDSGTQFIFDLCLCLTEHILRDCLSVCIIARRICSSRPGDGEQRGQSLAALTARGRGLDCFQPQLRQPVLRRNKLRIFRFRASAKAQPLRLFLLSPQSGQLCGGPNYGQTLCVQTDWAARGAFLARRKLASGSPRTPCAFPTLRCYPRCWLFSCLGL